jgi:hypothetical protein
MYLLAHSVALDDGPLFRFKQLALKAIDLIDLFLDIVNLRFELGLLLFNRMKRDV